MNRFFFFPLVLICLYKEKHYHAFALLSTSRWTSRDHASSRFPISPISLGAPFPLLKIRHDSLAFGHKADWKHRGSTLESSGSDVPSQMNDGLIPFSIAVGAITAAMGHLYGRALGVSVDILWTRLPSFLLRTFNLSTLNPLYFITGICTAGGLLIGLLSLKLGSTFAVSDFVTSFSSAPADILPSSRIHLLPLLSLSLMTSAFGFSVGPEAPMVCAGSLLGASLARRWYGRPRQGEDDAADSRRHQETLAYAGAAGALTAFMGIPVAGSIFALEMTRSNAGLNAAGERALSPAITASVAALALIRAFIVPSAVVGGHFAYGSIGALSGRAMIVTALAAGAGGGLLGTTFHKLVAFLKKVAWSAKVKKPSWKRQLIVKGAVGILVGVLSTSFPQTLFWGEGSLQCMIDGQQTPFAKTKHGLSGMLTRMSCVDPSLPFARSSDAVAVGIAKILSIALACVGKFPGGIIFPLFFAAAPFAHAFATIMGPGVLPVAVMCLMSSTQASVTRTPLATVMILSLTASPSTELSVMLPACLISSYFGVFVARRLSSKSYFHYSNNYAQ